VESRLAVGVGDWIAVGYRFRYSPRHVAVAPRFVDPMFTSTGARCVRTGTPVTLVVTAPTRKYFVSQDRADFLPGKRRGDPGTFQASVRYGVDTPDLCGGRKVNLTRGFTFSSDVNTVPSDAYPVKIQVHFVVPAASGRRNVHCGAVAAGAGVCRAPWSLPGKFDPPPTTFTPITSTTPVVPTALGQEIGDSAAITGAGPGAGGTVKFTVFGPSDQDCIGPPLFESTVVVSADPAGSASVSSGTFPVTQFGTYLWIAEYSGDPGTGTQPALSGCGAEVVQIFA
jgi:hypothetical protein